MSEEKLNNNVTIQEQVDEMIKRSPYQKEISSLREYFKDHSMSEVLVMQDYGGLPYEVERAMERLDIKMIVKIHLDAKGE